jgi:hypothetical protein
VCSSDLSGKGEKSPLTKWLDDLGTRGADKIQPIVDVLADAFRPLDSLKDFGKRYQTAAPAPSVPSVGEATTGGQDLRAKSAESTSSGFRGLGELYKMQADLYDQEGRGRLEFGSAFSTNGPGREGSKQTGIGGFTGRWSGRQGIADASFTTGLGEKRRLRTSADDKGDKKNLTLQEKQVSSLESIESKIGQALTVN